MATATPSWVGAMLAIERAALQRIWARAGAVALGLLTVEVGALALVTSLARLRLALHHGSFGAIKLAFGATGLGLDLCFVLGWLGFGLAVVAVARPLYGRALFLPAARTSAGAVAIFGVCSFVAYAYAIGMMQLLPTLLARAEGDTHSALVISLALTPSIALLTILTAAALAGLALVGRGLTPGRALATGLDHVMRRPTQSLSIFALHAALSLALVAAASFVHASAAAFVALAPLAALSALLAVSAYDAAIARDARLVTG